MKTIHLIYEQFIYLSFSLVIAMYSYLLITWIGPF